MASSTQLRDQTLALAGLVQAAKLVDQIAVHGACPESFAENSLGSLFAFEAANVEEVFGGVAGVKLGLDTLAALLNNGDKNRNANVLRYMLNLLYLERRFFNDADMMTVVRSRLEHVRYGSEHFDQQLDKLAHKVSGIYEDTLSTLSFRIKVSGDPGHLQNANNAAMIRALLLAGLRAAFMWRQLGGRRWKLLFQRGAILRCAQQLSRSSGVM